MFAARRWLIVAVAVLALPHRSVAQTQDINALRQAVAQTGGRIIVALKSTIPGSRVMAPGAPPVSTSEMNSIEDRISTNYPVQVTGKAPFVGALFVTASDADLARLAADPNVDHIEPDIAVPLTGAAARSIPAVHVKADASRAGVSVNIPWGVADVNAPAAWAAGIDGTGIKVGLIDTGIDYTHPDLVVAGGYDFTSNSASPSAWTDNVASCGGHGTHTAGTVGARGLNGQVIGVAPGAQIYALKVFLDMGGCLSFTSSQIIALQWAVTNHLDVVSISIANPQSSIYDQAVASATAAGVVVVASAGNDYGGPVVEPGSAPTGIAVAAVDPGNGMAAYSNIGPQIWVAAPGTSIESTVPGGGTAYKSGTSMAAPHVAGIAALVKQVHPTWSVDQIRNGIKALAVDIASPGFDYNSGWGLVQAPTSGGGGSTPVSIAVSPASRSTTAQQGNAAAGDNASVTLSGTNSGTTVWSASKRQSWTTLTTSSGTGSGTVAWSRNTTGLPAGTYVDTISVAAAGATGSPANIIDTLRITAPPPSLVVAVSPSSRRVSVQQGSAAPSDNASITLTGTGSGSATWSATRTAGWTTISTASGSGSGTVSWNRNTGGLSVGTYVDTITVTVAGATGSPARVIDTLSITAAPPPLVVAVSPASRSVSVQQGTAAPIDASAINFTGTGASTATWTASKLKPWTTLTSASGTGNGFVVWSRNATGLGVGVYVDTITVNAPGANGSPALVIDTLRITAAPPPLVVAVSPGSRNVSVQQGTAAPIDAAAINFTGTGASAATWTASKVKPWTTLTSASGTGNGFVTWSRNATGLAVGVYVDTITVNAPGANGSPATVIDTLSITAAPAPLVVAVSPASRNVSVQQGTAAPIDASAINFTGTGASTATWTASKLKPWTTLTTSSGTGNGFVVWSRNATGLAVGVYVDTITVNAPGANGSPAIVIDTLRITAAPQPLVVAVSPASRNVSVQQGTAAPIDAAAINFTGTGASTATWTASKLKPWTTLTATSGTGSGFVTWSRNATGLAVGVYVDTITVNAPGANGSPATVIDTLRITAAPVPLVVAVSPGSRSVSVQQGTAAPIDASAINFTGTGASAATWTASKLKPWTTLTSASGTGNGFVVWSRNATGLGVGVYVDTITVNAPGANGSPALVIDTLRITAAPPPLVVAVSPASRSASAQQGTAAPGDAATISFSGTGASTAIWTASKLKAWTTLTTPSGTGSGTVTWSRNASGLGVGVYVDTITISAAGANGSPARVIDTLRITAAPVPVVVSVSPAARSVTVSQGSSAGSDQAAVSLFGDNASAATWTASTHANWSTITTPSGTGNGTINWTRLTAALSPGLYVDTIVVSTNASGAIASIYDSVRVQEIHVPVPITVALSPTSRHVVVGEGGSAPSGQATVVVTGDNSSTAAWSASLVKPWAGLIQSSGTGTGNIDWTRNAVGLAVGSYVDTIRVVVAGNGATAMLIDTMDVIPVIHTIAILPVSRRSRMLRSGTASFLVTPVRDSALVEGDASDTTVSSWVATSSSSRVQLITQNGGINTRMVWQRPDITLEPGTYVDTIHVVSARNGGIQADFIDSLEVVQVTAPDPQAAVTSLFGTSTLTDDQRMLLDRAGNNNGRYDLGDLLAWIDHSHIKLSPSVASQLQMLMSKRQ